jgi:CheY-like chemotaxis protein
MEIRASEAPTRLAPQLLDEAQRATAFEPPPLRERVLAEPTLGMETVGGRARKARVLVVDDEEITRVILTCILTEFGLDVVEASNATDAIETLRAGNIDIVITDVVMPGMDGIELCERVKSNPALAHVPVVVATAAEDREVRLRSKSVGADEFITKPVDEVELLARVGMLLKLKSVHDGWQARERWMETELAGLREQLSAGRRGSDNGFAASVGRDHHGLVSLFEGSLKAIEEARERGAPAPAEYLTALRALVARMNADAARLLPPLPAA